MSPQPDPVIVPDDIREKFPKYVDLILGSESMSSEERSYWISVLPVMKTDQLASLEDILVTEKKQLEEIDRKYAGKVQALQDPAAARAFEEERTRRHKDRSQQETAAESAEKEAESALLEEISDGEK